MFSRCHRILAATAFALGLFSGAEAKAQELNCTVEVNSSSVESTSTEIFRTLQQSMTEYLNENQWTNAVFSPNERIECRLFLTVKEYKDEKVKGELQVQLSRPVYNSSYTTTIFNFKDTKVEFNYSEGDPLTFTENVWENNLTGILNYYAYLLLALDFDSFSPKGGQPYYDKAAAVVQLAQSSGEIGWRTFEDNRNRSAVLNSFTDTNTAMMRDLLYQYYRKGLDEMVSSPDKGRSTITESLKLLEKIYDAAPMSVALTIFRDAKLDELVNLYSKAPQSEREEVFELLKKLYPTDLERINKIRNPEDGR